MFLYPFLFFPVLPQKSIIFPFNIWHRNFYHFLKLWGNFYIFLSILPRCYVNFGTLFVTFLQLSSHTVRHHSLGMADGIVTHFYWNIFNDLLCSMITEKSFWFTLHSVSHFIYDAQLIAALHLFSVNIWQAFFRE